MDDVFIEMGVPAWLPSLLLMADHDNIFPIYIEAVYDVFRRDFVDSQPKLNGKWVRHRRDPIYDGKEAGFWHCASTGDNEDDRLPDMARCERIGWIRAVIENAAEPEINIWENKRGANTNTLLWFDEDYLVILGNRTRVRDGFQYYQLLTAYCTWEESRKKKLRRERDAYLA